MYRIAYWSGRHGLKYFAYALNPIEAQTTKDTYVKFGFSATIIPPAKCIVINF